MDNTSFVILPVEKVREMIEIAVSGCFDKALAALQPRQESESVDIEGALEFLNSNGYRIAKGQLYKETSAGKHTLSQIREPAAFQNLRIEGMGGNTAGERQFRGVLL